MTGRIVLLVSLAGCGRFGFGGDAKAVDGATQGSGDGAIDTAIDTPASDRYAAAVLADGPVGYWRLGDPTTAMSDSSGHQFGGSAIGGVMLGQPGLYASTDKAVGLDGATGYIQVSDQPALRIANAITLEAWIDAASFDHAAAGQYPRIVHKGSIGNTGYALMAFQIGTTNTANVRVEIEGLTQLGVTGSTTLNPNTTYHVAATWDGSLMKVFVNGAVDGVIAATGAIPMTTDPLDIGRRPDSQRYWAGVIDEVAIYNVALTPQQIAAHFAAGQ